MALTDYITVTITQSTVGLTRAGFGTAMHLSYTASWAERVRVYGSYSDVIADFPTTTGPEARAAQAYFSQNPAPTQFYIGRGALKPTKVLSLSAINPTSNVSYAYKVNVKFTGGTDITVTFTSDASPTDAEYAAGMVTALNAVPSKNFTASGASSPITITGNTAGAWFAIEVQDVNTQKITETTADPGVATDLTAINAENGSWYAVHTAFNSKAYGIAVAGWVESAGLKIYTPASNDTEIVISASTGTLDLMDQVKTNAYARTLVMYHRDAACFADAALLGVCLPFQPGSETWAFKTLAGIATFAMTATHRTNITSRNGNSYENVGVPITFYGMTGNGNFIDVRRGLDWIISAMSVAVFGAFAGNAKIPMTDPGIAVIESQMRGVLNEAVGRGILRPGFTITVPTEASIPAADKSTRTLNNLKWNGTTQGAVHKGNVLGSVTA